MQQGRQRLTVEQLAAIIGGCSGRDEVGLVTLAGDEDVSLMSPTGEQIRQPRGGTVEAACPGCAAMGQIGVDEHRPRTGAGQAAGDSRGNRSGLGAL